MIKTMILLVPTPFGQRDYERYGIDIFKNNGFNTNVWDITPVLYPDVYRRVVITDPLEWDNLIVFHRRTDVIAALEACPPQTFIFNTETYGRHTFWLYRAISKYRIPYGVGALSSSPTLRTDSLSAYAGRFAAITAEKLIWFLVRQMPLKFLGIRPAALVVRQGSKSSITRHDVTADTEVVHGQLSDYDIYLKLGSADVHCDGTAVFLDSYLPFHPDSRYSGEAPPVTPGPYYSALNRLFTLLEESGLRVIIAAHPRSRYEEHPGVFAHREVVRGRTAELVKRASLVVLHFSISVNFAVLYRKPCVFVRTDELEKSVYGKYIDAWAGELGKRAINIDRPMALDLTAEARVDEDAYAKYQDAYIKSAGSPEQPGWQIVCDAIKRVTRS